jgi:predicted ArsR family transcriptional regulator
MHTKKIIMGMLRRNKWTIVELASELETSRQAIQYHLKNIHGLKSERVKIDDAIGRPHVTSLYWLEKKPD